MAEEENNPPDRRSKVLEFELGGNECGRRIDGWCSSSSAFRNAAYLGRVAAGRCITGRYHGIAVVTLNVASKERCKPAEGLLVLRRRSSN